MLGDLDAAADHWNRALALNQSSAEAIEVLQNLSRLHRSTGNILMARRGYQKLAERRPWDPLILLAYSKVLAESGDVPQALVVARQAVSEDPHAVEAHLWLAELYRQSGDVASRNRSLERAQLLK